MFNEDLKEKPSTVPSPFALQVGYINKHDHVMEDISDNVNIPPVNDHHDHGLDLSYSLSPAMEYANELLSGTPMSVPPPPSQKPGFGEPIRSSIIHGGGMNEDYSLLNPPRNIKNAIPELTQMLDDKIGGFINNNSMPSNNNDQPNNTKYNMITLFWLLHEQKETFKHIPNYSDFITLTYNIDFGNLRIELLKLNEESNINNCVFLTSSPKLINCTIYPSSAFKIVSEFASFKNRILANPTEETTLKIGCIEELINNTNEQWQFERPITSVYLQYSNNTICITIEVISGINKEVIYYYSFVGWQIDCFISSLTYIFQDGFRLRGQKILNRQI